MIIKIPASLSPPSSGIRLLWYVLIAVTIVLCMQIRGIYKPQITLSLITPKAELIQVFCDSGGGFHEDTSSSTTTSGNVRLGAPFNIILPNECKKIRIDLGTKGSIVTLLSASLKSSNGIETNILTNIKTGQLNDAHFDESANSDRPTLRADGVDPYVILQDDFSTKTHVDRIGNLVKFFCLLLIITGCFWLAEYIIRNDSTLFTILLIAILLRVLFFIDSNLPNEVHQLQNVWPDEGTYFSYVTRLLDIGFMHYFDSVVSVEVAPGNIFYLSALTKLFGGEILAIRIFNLLFLSSAIVILTFKIAERLFTYRTAVVAAGLVAIYPELIVYSPTLLTEYLFLTFLLSFIYILLRITAQQNINTLCFLVIVGSCIGIFASITRLIFLPIVLLIFGYSVYLYFVKKNLNTSLAIASLAGLIFLGLIPFFINGHKHSGHYMIATGSGAALWLGSRGDTEGDEPPYRKKSYDTNLITGGASHLSLQGDRLLKEAAIRNIASDPVNYAWWSIKKIGRLLVGNNYFWFFPKNKFSQWAMGSSICSIFVKLLSLLIASTVAVFGASYALIHKKIDTTALLVFSSMLVLVATYIPFLVNQRYGLPMFVLGSIFAAYVISEMWGAKYRYRLISLIVINLAIVGQIATGA